MAKEEIIERRAKEMSEDDFETKTNTEDKIKKSLKFLEDYKKESEKNFFIIPECEYYRKDGNCNRSSKEKESYGCNEIYCEKKIKKEYEKLKEIGYQIDPNGNRTPIKMTITPFDMKKYIKDNKQKESEEKTISKNVIFPTKLSFQEQYPESSIYKTPEYIKELRNRCKKCSAVMENSEDGYIYCPSCGNIPILKESKDKLDKEKLKKKKL